MEQFKTFVEFRGDYLTGAKEGKGAFYVTLMPRPDKYYIVGVVSDPIGHVTQTETITITDGIETTEFKEKTERKFEFTAYYVKRLKNTALRLGLTENTVGIGADQFFLNDRLKLSADAWDFKHDEAFAINPHLKIGIDYYLLKNLFISAGGDNLFNSKWRGFYFGAGFNFEDKDLKYMFRSIPVGAL